MPTTEMRIGPRPLSQRGVKVMQSYLCFGHVVRDRVSRTDFSSKTGTFTVNEGGYLGFSTELWCKELIGLDPDKYSLRAVRRGALAIQSLSGGVERIIEVSDVREVVQYNSGKLRVYDSGYLMAPGFKKIGDQFVSDEEFQQVLLDAEKGVKPPIFDVKPFIKVDCRLAEQALYVVSFKQQVEPFWMEDVVVINDKGQLVPREIYHSLSPYRWGWEAFGLKSPAS